MHNWRSVTTLGFVVGLVFIVILIFLNLLGAYAPMQPPLTIQSLPRYPTALHVVVTNTNPLYSTELRIAYDNAQQLTLRTPDPSADILNFYAQWVSDHHWSPWGSPSSTVLQWYETGPTVVRGVRFIQDSAIPGLEWVKELVPQQRISILAPPKSAGETEVVITLYHLRQR
jgi:hypothetical protein